ncbi:MAG: glutamine--fructose-6-phosphate transaminase (isomerizing) [Spirochaetota bacterium]|nr:glutamine--fructose-6-phosphate transaminase (isomerizing) [Spirochaetota bacterium]
MCGIVGYVGNKNCVPILLDSLKKMEYRGYDSSGIAYSNKNNSLSIIKNAGKIADLEKLIHKGDYPISPVGIGHTRWATHGEPNQVNAHPHPDCHGQIIVVHNGIIENYQHLKNELIKKGHVFKSETDTEVLAHLIEENYDGDLEIAVRESLHHVIGAYGLVAFCENEPDTLVAARYGSPLILGKGRGENLVASDVSALLRHTSDVVYLEDGEIATLKSEGFSIKNLDNEEVDRDSSEVSWKLEDISKNGFPTYMLKEIFEQSMSIKNAMRGRLNVSEGNAVLQALNNMGDRLRQLNRVIITAMGTSFHAAMIGEYLIEEIAKIPVEVEYAAEFRYRGPILDSQTLVIVISQSGETADTLGALREAKLKGASVLSICNVVGSSIARESHGGVFLHAGPEIGVASTKAFTSQVTVLGLVALYLGRSRYLSLEEGKQLVAAFESMPGLIENVIQNSQAQAETIAHKFVESSNALYLGRGYNYPVALEGALKLKEISYIHAEGYNAAEMKHGPIALIDENMPVFVIALRDSLYDKIISNIEEVKARKGVVIAIATEGDEEIRSKVDHVIYIPEVAMFLSPLLSVIPLQLIAYYLATYKGCDVDQPRNLAKSVTVE